MSTAKTGYGKVNQIAYNFNDREALEEIMNTGETSTILVDRFNIHTMYSEKEKAGARAPANSKELK